MAATDASPLRGGGGGSSRGAYQEDLPAEHYKREIVRVHGLWREAKDNLRRAQGELADLQTHVGLPGDGGPSNELVDRLRFNELQLDRERGRSRLLQTNLEDSRMALAMCEAEIDKQAAERRVEAEQLLALRQQIKSLHDEKQAALEQTFRELRARVAEVEDLKVQTRQQQDHMHGQALELDRLARDNQALDSKSSVLEMQFDAADQRVRELGKQVNVADEEMRHTRNLSASVKAREQHLMEQQRQLLSDNKRLLKLLAQTSDYKAIAHDMHDAGGGISFVEKRKGPPAHRGFDGRGGLRGRSAKAGVQAVSQELELWVPAEVSEAALDFRMRL